MSLITLNSEGFTPKNNINEYLADDWNVDFHQTFLDVRSRLGNMDALEYFNLLYETWAILKANKEKPLAVRNYIWLELEIEDHQRLLLMSHIIKLTEGYEDDFRAFRRFFDKDYRYLNSTLHSKEDKDHDSLKAPVQGSNENQPKQQNLEQNHLKGHYTNGQIVLIFHYFLKYTGLKLRSNIDIAPIAKFIHLITGKEFKTTANSDIYDKLRRAPNFKKDKSLINDLHVIKPMFEAVELNEVAKMIQNEIETAFNERSNSLQ